MIKKKKESEDKKYVQFLLPSFFKIQVDVNFTALAKRKKCLKKFDDESSLKEMPKPRVSKRKRQILNINQGRKR